MTYPLSIILIVSILIFIVIVISLCLHKVTKIHLATDELIRDTNHIRQEAEGLFSQIQSLMALERKLNMKEPLPSMRGWAGSPDFLLKVADVVLLKKPMIVVECSSGVSTIVIARCLQLNGHGHVYSLEHSGQYAEKTRAMLQQHCLSDWVTVLIAPLVISSTSTPWYDGSSIPKNLAPIDILVIDGPPAATAPLARYPALPQLAPLMAKNSTVLLDDADRADEVEVLSKWKYEFPDFEQIHLGCEKGLVQLSRTPSDER